MVGVVYYLQCLGVYVAFEVSHPDLPIHTLIPPTVAQTPELNDQPRKGKRLTRTTSSSTAYSPIPRVLRVAANISHARIIQALALVLLAIHVLNAPETARSHRGGLRARRHGHGLRGRVGHCAEGAQELGQKGHGKEGEEEEDYEVEGGRLQIGREICRL